MNLTSNIGYNRLVRSHCLWGDFVSDVIKRFRARDRASVYRSLLQGPDLFFTA